MRKSENGVTMIILVIMIMVLVILVSITVMDGNYSIDSTVEEKLVDDLQIIQHAVLEQYTKYTITKDVNTFKGEKISNLEEIKNVATSVGVNLIENDRYYKLNKQALKDIGIKNTENEDEYIVNYFTGEVLNYTEALKGKKVYTYSVNTNDLQSL